MNKKIYAASLIFLFAFHASAMEYTQAVLAEAKVSETNSIPIHVPKVRNAKGVPYAEEDLELNNKDSILLESFEDLIAKKHAKNDSYLLARTLEQVDDGSVVNYFDAHAFNRAVFGQYAFNTTFNELSVYKHPITNKSLHCLEYYECLPDTRVFTLMCTYAALRSSDAKKQEFYRLRFYVNQDDDLGLAANAQSRLGCMYQLGQVVAVNYPKARQLYEQAANQKYDLAAAASAQNGLGYMYQLGLGVAVNYPKARQLYEQAANQKNNLGAAANAQSNLGYMYQIGLGLAVDHRKASQLYEQAANQKDHLGVAAIAQNNLGHMYRYGLGVAVDHPRALQLYEQAANQKDHLGVAACAQNNLGYMYHHGLGVARDYTKAKQLYEQAANQKNALEVAALARKSLEELEELMKKND